MANIKNICIVGGDSFIGQNLYKTFSLLKFNCIKTSRKLQKKKNTLHLDLINLKGLNEIPSSLDLIIFCAGMTSIKDCQQDPNKSHLLNVKNTILTCNHFNSLGIPVYFYQVTLYLIQA